MKEIVDKLIKNNKIIAAMESCTGGAVASAITDIEGASEILKFSAVTYSNEYKIKMGVSSKIIDEYSVYSIEVAKEMSRNISFFANSNYGVGVTGKLNRIDPNNSYGEDNIVFISIYDRDNNKYLNDKIEVLDKTRQYNKKLVINKIIEMLNSML